MGFSKWLCAAAMLLRPGISDAHHSYAMFDPDKTLTLKGTFKTVSWTNPHSWFTFVAIDGGKQTEWSFEGASPVVLIRQGWRPNMVKPGDQATVTVHPRRDGSMVASLTAVTFPDGRRLTVTGTQKQENAQ